MASIRKGLPFIVLLCAFGLGLLIVLAPLTQYNAEYFGGPFNSGYDATPLTEFNRTGTIDVRNATEGWTSNVGSYVTVAMDNLVKLAPTFLNMMPALIFLPVGIYCMRRKRLALAMLLAWAGINLFTYLSLEWVAMYARADLVPWEPRYWMPSIPPVSIIGAYGIWGLSHWIANRLRDEEGWQATDRAFARKIVACSLVGILVLWSAVPAIGYLQNPKVTEGRPPQNQQVIPVTTDQLLSAPQNFIDRAVVLNNVIVVFVGHNFIEVRSHNATVPGTVPIRFVEWPPGTLPQFERGQHLDVRGMFHRDPAPPGQLPTYSVGVKYNTQDFVRLLSP